MNCPSRTLAVVCPSSEVSFVRWFFIVFFSFVYGFMGVVVQLGLCMGRLERYDASMKSGCFVLIDDEMAGNWGGGLGRSVVMFGYTRCWGLGGVKMGSAWGIEG